MQFSAFDAYLFDLDGVITPTAEVHMKAWAEMFNAFLAGFPGQLPWTDADYFAHVDGKPRYDGVRDFLSSRGIELPEGSPQDAAAEQSICGLGNRKNETFNEIIRRDGVAPYPGSKALIEALQARGAGCGLLVAQRGARAAVSWAGGRFPGDRRRQRRRQAGPGWEAVSRHLPVRCRPPVRGGASGRCDRGRALRGGGWGRWRFRSRRWCRSWSRRRGSPPGRRWSGGL